MRSPGDAAGRDAAALRALQRAFLGETTGRRRMRCADRARVFRRPPRGSVAGRCAIYAHGYVARIVEALAAEYGAVQRILGAAAFESLVVRYLDVQPPESFDLAHAGSRLPAYLWRDPLTGSLPFLPDLALLEQRIAHAFVAADSTPLSWSDLVGADPAAVAAQPFALRPGVAAVRSEWPLFALWSTRWQVDGEVHVDLGRGGDDVLVVRRDVTVHCEPVDPGTARLVALLRGTGAFTLDRVLGTGGLPPATIAAAFRDLADRGALTRPNPHEEVP